MDEPEDQIFSRAGLERFERETWEGFMRWRREHPEWSHLDEAEKRKARRSEQREPVWA